MSKGQKFLGLWALLYWFLNNTRGRAFRMEISKIHRVWQKFLILFQILWLSLPLKPWYEDLCLAGKNMQANEQVVLVNSQNKMDHIIWKRMINCARKIASEVFCIFVCSCVFVCSLCFSERIGQAKLSMVLLLSLKLLFISRSTSNTSQQRTCFWWRWPQRSRWRQRWRSWWSRQR